MVSVVGLGYIGLLLVLGYANAGIRSIGFAIDQSKAEALLAGRSSIKLAAWSDLIVDTRNAMAETEIPDGLVVKA